MRPPAPDRHPRLRRAARWTAARARRGLRRLRPAAGALGRVAWRHRRGGLAIGLRGAWWIALWLLVAAGSRLLGWRVEEVDASLWHPFALGIAVCAAVVLLAQERHLRWLATGLGTAHGALAMLAWATIA